MSFRTPGPGVTPLLVWGPRTPAAITCHPDALFAPPRSVAEATAVGVTVIPSCPHWLASSVATLDMQHSTVVLYLMVSDTAVPLGYSSVLPEYLKPADVRICFAV